MVEISAKNFYRVFIYKYRENYLKNSLVSVLKLVDDEKKFNILGNIRDNESDLFSWSIVIFKLKMLTPTISYQS